MKKLIIISILFSLFSCNNDDTKKQINSLEKKIEFLEQKNVKLENEIYQLKNYDKIHDIKLEKCVDFISDNQQLIKLHLKYQHNIY